MANTFGGFNPSPHPASSSLARPSLHDMVLEHDGPLPFIWRNLVKWHGGKPDARADSLHQQQKAHNAGQPPHKRRRFLPPDPAAAAIASTLPVSTEPVTRPLEEPPSSASFLKLEVSSVAHRESVASGAVLNVAAAEPARFPATCRATLYQGQSIFDRVLHCQSLPCELLLSKNATGTYDIFFSEVAPAIFIPRHALNVVNRTKGTFGLNQSYFLTIDLEAGDGTRWPPLSRADMGVSTLSEVDQCSVLRATSREVLGKMRLPVDLVPNASAPVSLSHTHFIMKVDVGWVDAIPSVPLPSRSLPTPDNTTGSPQRTTTSSAFAESLVERSLTLADDDEDDHAGTDGAPTPSRSLRIRRSEMVYNLKDLSDKQLGRERRRNGQIPPAATPRADQTCWQFSSGESIWAEANRCLICRRNTLFRNFNQLVNHIELAHSDLKYEAKATRQGHAVEIATNFKIDLTPTKPLNFVRESKRIDLQAYEDGDQAWLSYRYEEEPEVDVQTPRRNRQAAPATPTTRKSKVSPQQLAGEKRRRVNVPRISETPLYHPVSKQLLTPGEELPRPAPDKQWILQKYKEALREFSDITAEEREYMFKWDSFLQPLNVTTAAHLPEIWYAFVDKHADWLVDKDYRMLEFTKHAALLFGRSLINSAADVSQRLNVARRLKQDRELQNGAANGTAIEEAEALPEDDLTLSPRLEHVKKGSVGCIICKLPVRGPKQLLCTGDGCLRLFHSTCAKDTAKMPIKSRKWRCNTCLDVAKSDLEAAS